MKKKAKLAFVDLSNYKNWPVGGMLQYELAILPYLAQHYDLDLWGVSVNGIASETISLNGNDYNVNIWTNVKTAQKLIPNYWKGLSLYNKRNCFLKYDVVYVHTGSCTTALSWGLRKYGTKIVHHQHGLSHVNDYAIKSLIQRPFVNRAQDVADLVFVVSDLDAVNSYVKEYRKKSKAQFIAIGSPIDLSLFEGESKVSNNCKTKELRLIYTGRIDKHKDVTVLVDVFNYYQKINTAASLIIVGDGEERENVSNRVKEFGLEKKIRFTGALPRKKVLEELKNADIYLTASIGEGSSISVLEAYASGLPVICFDVPGLRKQVKDGITGIVVKKRTAKDMCNAIEILANNRENFSKNCLMESKQYDAQVISSFITEKIDQLLDV